MQILLIGEKDSERTSFFAKAADDLGIALRFAPLPDYNAVLDFDLSMMKNCAVKIDPPDIRSIHIEELNAFGHRYSSLLTTLQNAPGTKFLNAPECIAHTLDKIRCKRAFLDSGVRTAPCVSGVDSISDLRKVMSDQRIGSVFIKHRFGSGAAGIIAFRRNINTGEEVIYTTALKPEGLLCNTRKLRRLRDPREIDDIAGGILNMGAMVEKWIPKAKTGGKAYDIRAVWQLGKIEYAVARLSAGTITNLHLGGDAVDLDELKLSSQTLYEIEDLCKCAMCVFPGLNSAGIDILLEKDTLKPYIIEINGQGDLLYKDIHSNNKIYKNQLLYLKNIT